MSVEQGGIGQHEDWISKKLKDPKFAAGYWEERAGLEHDELKLVENKLYRLRLAALLGLLGFIFFVLWTEPCKAEDSYTSGHLASYI